MPTREQIQDLVSGYVDAVSRRDVEASVACFTEDAIQEDPVGTAPNEGRAAIRDFFEKSFAADFEVEADDEVLIGGGHASFRFVIKVATGGDPFVVRVADLGRVTDEGLFDRLWAVQDAGA